MSTKFANRLTNMVRSILGHAAFLNTYVDCIDSDLKLRQVESERMEAQDQQYNVITKWLPDEFEKDSTTFSSERQYMT